MFLHLKILIFEIYFLLKVVNHKNIENKGYDEVTLWK